MDFKLKKKYFLNSAIAIISALAIILSCFLFPGFYELFELKTLDLRFQLRKPLPQRQDIVFVEMDEQAISDLGRWPWPRDTFSHIVDTLRDLSAKAVLFDVTFTDSSQLVIDREKLKEGIQLDENKKILDDFINETENLFTEGKIGPDQVRESLAQIRSGLGLWKEGIDETLKSAIRDTDTLLAKSIKNAGNVYLGFKAEVIYLPEDIKRYEVKAAPDKIYQLLNRQPELSLNEAASLLQENNLARLRPKYNDAKNEVYREKIEMALKENPLLSFKELVWKIEIIDPANIQILKGQYDSFILERAFSQKTGIVSDETKLLPAINISPPILPLTESMRQSGFLNAIPDKDGVLRKVPLFIRYKDKIYPHIALWVIADLKQEAPEKYLESLPLDKNSSLLINWAGKWNESFRHLSASDIYRLYQLQENINYNLGLPQDDEILKIINADKERLKETKEKLQKEIKDSICIIGLTAPGTHDYNPIPLQPDYPMVGTHANIINTILQEKFIRQINPQINIGIILLIGIFTAVCITSLSPVYSLISTAAISIFYCLLCLFLFNQHGLWIEMIRPLFTVLLSYIGINSYSFATEQKEKRWIRKAFGHYISKNVMEEILKDPAKLKLGGERKELTVLFSDIRSFTSYSETRQPEEVVSILNEYLTEMTKIVFKYNGTLDKYVGDEIMAIFGAPSAKEETDHAQRAVLAALEMLEKLKELHEKWRKEGKEPFDIGIGINTGPMLVGNMGSADRMDYTVIGDSVNLGARVEALTRQYNNHLIITESTYNYVKNIVQAKKLEEVKVKGKEKAVLIYEVTNRLTEPNS